MLEQYIPFIVGAGLFLGAIFAGVWKGKQDAGVTKSDKKELVAGVLQDNYSMVMLSEQLRVNKEQMEKVNDTLKDLINEMERLREYARDISKVLETGIKM